ncbi:hypothetical protein NUW54_g2807 [Trametes sanguinea]|uniref:Uncharacterized protein n=1 Tax=Trametes sanguinea TaxID=158606 RepID=A0ACC1Q4S9_9APHY|nr:hypothetical protein NUW54_g2807 [Trametes sanguinea]
MTELHGDGGPLPHIPDDLTIPQFLLDSHHPSRPVLRTPQPWLIEELTGREIGSDELRARTFGLANAFRMKWNIGEDDVVCIFGPNHIDYPVAIWCVESSLLTTKPSRPDWHAVDKGFAPARRNPSQEPIPHTQRTFRDNLIRPDPAIFTLTPREMQDDITGTPPAPPPLCCYLSVD